jgi:signal transduction histidine kinase
MLTLLKKISLTLVGLLLLGAAGAYWTYQTSARIQADGLRELTRVNRLVISAFDPQDLQGLSFTEADRDNPVYLRLRNRLIRLEGTLQNSYPIRGSYIMVKPAYAIVFATDAAPVGDSFHSEPGTVYEQPPQALLETVTDGQTRTTGPYTDEFGTYYSVFATMRGEDGRPVAYVGTDIERQALEKLASGGAARTALLVLCVLLAFALASGITQRLFSHRRRLRERDAELLRQAEEREKMLMNIGEGVVAFDRSGRVIFANKFAVESVGCSGESHEQNYWQHWMLVNEQGVPFSNEPPAVAQADAAAADEAKGKEAVTYLRRSNGQLFPVVVSLVDVNLGFGEPATVMTFRDTTRETEIDRMKSDFINIAVHQLKTPLTALRWSVETLTGDTSTTKFTTEEEQTIKDIASVTQILNNLVTSLLNIARVESGRLTVDPKPTDLGDLVTAVVRENTAAAEAKGQKIIVALSAGLPQLNVDATLVREIVKNFLTNAIKYTPNGGHIEARLEAEANEVTISVKDNGIGIPVEDQKRVSDKFFRASNAIGSSEDGTGLGLYFAKQIIEVSGGRFGFESVEGGGSTFHFSLPLTGSEAKHGQVRLS